MSLNTTPSGERIHIGFFGKRNAGKSSVVNAVTGQELAVVSDVLGTTTDPVYKSMELLPLGPVMIIDTPGFDDEGSLGELRVQKTKQVLNKTDVAVLVTDATHGLTDTDKTLINLFAEREIPCIIAYNKADLLDSTPEPKANEIYVSAKEKTNIYRLKEKIGALSMPDCEEKHLVADLVKPNDFIVLVVPIDSAAPKGKQPAMVLTDRQAFDPVSKIVPENILLTSFSILMARYKGLLTSAVKGAAMIDKLNDGDKILISEGCTHHRQCNDIGTVKLPNWLKKHTGKELNFEFSSGTHFPEDLTKYKLIIHCGGCMLNEREVRYRVKCAENQGAPITNYGIAIAFMNGILKRSLEVFPELYKEL